MFKIPIGAACATVALASFALAQPPATTPAQTAAAASTPTAAKDGPVSFEVATIKAAKPLQEQALSGKMHIGLNVDAAHADIGAMSISDLIAIAYKVKPHQIVGPDWLPVDRFDIMGKIPDGVSKDRLNDMIQSLLAERFGLKFHHEQREQQVYALVVAKGGIKMKESPPDEPAPAAGTEPEPKKDEKGTMTFGSGDQQVKLRQTGNGSMSMSTPKNGNIRMAMEDGHMRMHMDKMTCEGLAEALSRFVDKPIMDMTELKGNYQMTLDLSMEDLMNAARAQGMQIPTPPPAAAASGAHPLSGVSDPGSSSILSTIQALGLKLDLRKMPVDTLIIDHVEKTPTEN